MIGSKEMVSASLAEIYAWTGVRVNFFVNILRSVNPGTGDNRDGTKGEWRAVQDLGKRAEVVEELGNEGFEGVDDGRCDAYLVSSSFSSA